MKRTVNLLILGAIIFTASISPISPKFENVDAVTHATSTTPAKPAVTAPSKPATAVTVTAKPQTTTSTVSANSSHSGATHKVVSGDALWKIAKKHNMSLEKLLALNPQIKNPNRISVGQLINIEHHDSAIVSEATSSVTDVKTVPAPVAISNPTYKDGTYRGIFMDSGEQQVGIQFKLKNNIVTEASFRVLAYKGIDYKSESADEKIKALNSQYIELLNYLIGKDISISLEDLYSPANIVSSQTVGVDTLSGATIRNGKVISAIRDGLNRGVYSY